MNIPLFHPSPVRWTLLPVFLAAICALTACFSRPSLKRETFSFTMPANPGAKVIDPHRVLGIRSLQIASPFDGRSLVYRTGEFSYVRDPYAEFLEPPAKELASPLRDCLRHYGGRKAVVEAGSAITPDLMLEITVNQLYGDFRKSEHPVAVLVIHCVCLEATNGIPRRAVLEHEYSRRVALSAPTASALMAGWNQGLGEIVADLASDLWLSRSEQQSQ